MKVMKFDFGHKNTFYMSHASNKLMFWFSMLPCFLFQAKMPRKLTEKSKKLIHDPKLEYDQDY